MRLIPTLTPASAIGWVKPGSVPCALPGTGLNVTIGKAGISGGSAVSQSHFLAPVPRFWKPAANSQHRRRRLCADLGTFAPPLKPLQYAIHLHSIVTLAGDGWPISFQSAGWEACLNTMPRLLNPVFRLTRTLPRIKMKTTMATNTAEISSAKTGVNRDRKYRLQTMMAG